MCGARRPCKRRERRLTGRALAVGVRKDLGGLRCLTLRYSLLLSVWVDPSAEHTRSRVRLDRFILGLTMCIYIHTHTYMVPRHMFLFCKARQHLGAGQRADAPLQTKPIQIQLSGCVGSKVNPRCVLIGQASCRPWINTYI